jgi:DNA-binding winged helix-turn-helix (wHTH) protein/tetratricopeptide (TPR) repeat protein
MTIVRYRFGDYALDLAKHELQHHGVAVALPARVFECLCCLIEHRDRAVSRDELVQAMFGRLNVSDAQLAQVVLRSRRAIGDDGQEQHSIRTVPRFGFRWLQPVVVEDGDETPVATPVTSRQPLVAHVAAHDPPRDDAAPLALRTRHRWPRLLGWGAAAIIALAVLAWAVQRLATGDPAATSKDAATLPARAVLVLPTEVERPGDASWARLGLMDFIGDRLRRGGLPVLPSETVLGVLREHEATSSVRGARELRGLRAATRAEWIVSSRATRDAGAWNVALSAADGRLTQRGRGRHADLLEAARLAADRLSAALGGRAPGSEGEAPGLAERLQRARAAMLANEIETARRILVEAPELQRAQPRLRYQLARVDFRAGEYARGLSTLDALLAGSDASTDPAFHVQLLNARGAMLIRLDRYHEAQRAYDQAIALAGDRHPAELGIALSGRAVAYSLQREYDAALADYGQARVQLGNAGDALAVARVDANLGILEVERGRPAHALPYLAKAADDFSAMGAANELATLRNIQVVARLHLLQLDEALAESTRAWAMLPRIRDPSQRADLMLTRAEALLATGQLREAGRLLAMPEAARAAASEHGRREYLQVELARRVGAAARAAALADEALRDWPPAHNPRLRTWMQLRRTQAALDADLVLPNTVLPAVPTANATVPEVLTAATVLRARGDQSAADGSYRAALALAEQRGVPAEISAVVVAHASWLLDRGRNDEASALIGRAAPWAGDDFDLAVLQVRLLRALGQRAQWQDAYERASALAGERSLPAELAPARQRPTGAAR